MSDEKHLVIPIDAWRLLPADVQQGRYGDFVPGTHPQTEEIIDMRDPRLAGWIAGEHLEGLLKALKRERASRAAAEKQAGKPHRWLDEDKLAERITDLVVVRLLEIAGEEQ